MTGNYVYIDQGSQYPNLPTPGAELPTGTRIPMPLFDPPTREENPIPESESNILAGAFPTLFQTGEADINSPRLRSLEDDKGNVLSGYIRHLLFWHDNRFAQHPRLLYCLYNRKLREELWKTKSFFMKNRKPTAEDFKPENKNKTVREMRAYAAKLRTTAGFKLERRNEVENMSEQTQYMTANKEKVERVNIEQEEEDYESSDEETVNTDFNVPFSDPSHEQTDNIKTVHKRPIHGVIPCYWATLTTAPFRSSVISYYINGHHDTEKDVRVRRKLAIKNPNIVAFFSALRLELILKYLMVDMLELKDYYCVFEWGSGGVLHLHCILWNFNSQYLDNWDLKQREDKQRTSKIKMKLIAVFFNVHVSEWNLGKEEDGSWKNMPADTDDAPHPASISKQEFDELLDPFILEDDLLTVDEQREREEAKSKRLKFLVELIEKVQQHNIHKPNPFGPPLPNQKCSKQKPASQKNEAWETKHYCGKGYPKQECQFEKEYILQEPYKKKLYKLYLERNDRTLNNYNPIIILALLANMDLQPVLSYEGLLSYCTKYITKNDNPDMFRDFRDDTGKPTDAGANVDRTEIPIQNLNVRKLVGKLFNDTIKYSMLSSPELNHHLLNLPTHYTSRSFLRISLQSDLSKLLTPLEVTNENNQLSFVKEDEVSIYEKRCSFGISGPAGIDLNKKDGEKLLAIKKEDIEKMSLFLFHKKVFVRKNPINSPTTHTICRKTKAPIIIFKPYISPKKKNNPKYHQYMVLTLLAFKPFKHRREIISIADDDLEKIFNEFLASDICPFFVQERHYKSNKKRVNKKKNKERELFTSQDEIEDVHMGSPSDEESDSDTEINTHQDESNQRPQIGKFTEAYQEYGHTAPRLLDYDGSDFDYFDDDKDVKAEINILDKWQDLIFDHSKDTWQPKHPSIIDLASNAQETIKQNTGVRNTSQYLNPQDLDPTQTLFVDTILEWEAQCIKCKKDKIPFPPLKVKLLGVAGTGKSRTIKTLVQEFNKVMRISDLPENEHGKIKMCAPTGVAAFNIGCGAASVHKTFNIPVRGDLKDLTGERQKQLELDFENVWVVIIDEISMVGCEMLAKVNDRLIQAKLDDNHILSKTHKNPLLQKPEFGGVGMVLCGDFGQLVPIMQHSLMDNIRLPIKDLSKQSDRYTNKGKELIDQFKISIILTKQHRQNKGIYNDLCLKFRNGSFTIEDHKLLQKRDYFVVPTKEINHIEEYGTRLVTTNMDAGIHNATKLLQTVAKTKNKIFRLHAHETGNKGRATTSAENFSGLKSLIHITIGSRVMLTSNMWVEAGLINGAQGTVEDIVFNNQENEDSLPTYVLVNLDQFNGPNLFNDNEKDKWVPIFPITRQHQYTRHIERTQIPLRLCSAMTGHKVQGLSLYNGVVIQYPEKKTNPTDEKEKKKYRKTPTARDPLCTWGLNYCMLTRVPDFSKIAFKHLPSYERHMQLYNKSKGKYHYQFFQRFDERAYTEFSRYVNICGGKSLDYLKSAKEKLNLISPINFHVVLQEEIQECQQQHVLSALHQVPSSVGVRQATTSHISKDDETLQSPNETYVQEDSSVTTYDVHEQPNENRNTMSMFSKFANPINSNNCWFNSVLQVIIHSLKHDANLHVRYLPRDQDEDNSYATTFFNMLDKFSIPGETYNVKNRVKYPIGNTNTLIPYKHLMLEAMGIPELNERDKQQDASPCIQYLITNVPQLEFLSHNLHDQIDCQGCNYNNSPHYPMAISLIPISKTWFENKKERFSAKDAITEYFQGQ